MPSRQVKTGLIQGFSWGKFSVWLYKYLDWRPHWWYGFAAAEPPAHRGPAMARKLTKNNEHFRRAVKRLPLGVASNFRYWGEDRTIYVKYGRGARIVDLDDNVYIDYRMGYGPAILGYADPRVDEAAREGMAVGGVFALATERELSVAER